MSVLSYRTAPPRNQTVVGGFRGHASGASRSATFTPQRPIKEQIGGRLPEFRRNPLDGICMRPIEPLYLSYVPQ